MSAAQVLKKVDPGCYVSRSRRLRISRNNFNFGLNRGADLTDLRKQSIWICCIETKLFGSESDGCTFYAVKMLDLFFHLGSTVSTAKVLQDVDTLRRCCAVGVVMAMFVPMFMILTATAAVLIVVFMVVMFFMRMFYMVMYIMMVVTASA